jgi:hypothetical protein
MLDAGTLEHDAILLHLARIGAEILVRAELRGVDEDRDADGIGVLPARPDQGHVALVQGAHGGHQREAPSACPEPAHRAAKIVYRLDRPHRLLSCVSQASAPTSRMAGTRASDDCATVPPGNMVALAHSLEAPLMSPQVRPPLELDAPRPGPDL